MANVLTPAQRNSVVEALNLDRASNYSRLEYYLKQIISGRDVVFETKGNQPLKVSSQEAWGIILSWSQEEGNLPVGDRKDLFNARSRASRLLNYIQTNIIGKTAEAAASYQLILDQASNKVAPVLPSRDPQDYNHQKIYDLRRLQTDILQAGIIGKVYSNLEKSKILAGVPAESRNYVLRMFASANQNFRYNPQNPSDNFTPEKIHQLLLHTPGVKDVNSIIRLFYSNAAQGDIKAITEIIEKSIQEQYGGDEAKYEKDMDSLRNLTSLSPSLNSVSYLVNSIDIHATPAEKIILIRNLKSQIISAASGNHQNGEQLLRSALRSAGFPEASAASYKAILPYLEELEVKERHILLGSGLSEHDSRLLATKNLAKELGVDLKTPWLSQKELDKVTTKLTGGKSLQEAFDLEYAKGKNADLYRLTELSDLMGRHSDLKTYHDALGGNLWYQLRDVWDKGSGSFYAAKQPLDRFTGKLWAGYNKIDDAINWPIFKLADTWEGLQTKYPLLDPVGFVLNRWTSYQTGIALRIHGWAIGVSTSSWFAKSGFAGHIADFTEGFIKHEGDWGGATTFFVERKWGNALDWATKTFTKEKSFSQLKISVAKTVWSGFSSMAPELSAKMAAGSLGKAVATFLAGDLTLGASIAIQIAGEAIKIGATEVIKFVKSVLSGDSKNLYGTIPLILGSLFLAINTALGGLPALVILSLKLLRSLLAEIGKLFLALLAVSAIVSACVVAFFVIIWYHLISPTFNLESGTAQLVASIICNQSGQNTGDPTANAAVCIAQVLSDCQLNPVFAKDFGSDKWKCVVAALAFPGAVSQLEASKFGDAWTPDPHLQCVGLAAAAAGSGFPQMDACIYAKTKISGYNFTQQCKPGSLFVDAHSCPGHIGVVISCDNATITCVDANLSGPGQVRGPADCRFPTSKISGYLNKI